MRNGFTKGLMVGSIIGASMSMMMNPDMMKNRTKRKMMRTGKNFLKRSGNIIGDMIDILK